MVAVPMTALIGARRVTELWEYEMSWTIEESVETAFERIARVQRRRGRTDEEVYEYLLKTWGLDWAGDWRGWTHRDDGDDGDG